jgi:hypothetical protein
VTPDGELGAPEKTPLSPTAQKALATIRNLRELSQETGCVSTRAQHDVLRKLNSEDFAAVADALADTKKKGFRDDDDDD